MRVRPVAVRRSRTPRRGWAAAGVAAAIGLAGCGSGAPAAAAPSASAGGAGPTGGSAASVAVGFSGVYPTAARRRAPALSAHLLGGGSLSLAALRGHVVVVNFWASWCHPCQLETPLLEQAYRAGAPWGLRVVGVDVADSSANAIAFRHHAGVTYPSVADPQGQLLARFPGVPASALPSSVIIDAQGRIAGVWVGPVSEPTLLDALRQIAGVASSAAGG